MLTSHSCLRASRVFDFMYLAKSLTFTGWMRRFRLIDDVDTTPAPPSDVDALSVGINGGGIFSKASGSGSCVFSTAVFSSRSLRLATDPAKNRRQKHLLLKT